MGISENRNIAIVGVGPAMSRSLAVWLASLGWNIALISRSEKNLSAVAEDVKKAQKSAHARVIYRAADASSPASLKDALDWSVEQLGGKLDVLSYNAAHVAGSSVLDLSPETLEADFRVSAVGTLVAGQWFTQNAQVSRVTDGELPLFLITGGVLDKYPQPTFASLSTVKAASQTLSRLFAKELPEKHNILVGMPLVVGLVKNPETGEFNEENHPDIIVQKVFKPFFEDRENVGNSKHEWVVERVF